MENALVGSNAFIRSVLDHSPSLIYVKSSSGKYLIVNAKYLEIFGFKEADVLGRTDSELFPKEMTENWNTADTVVLEKGKPLQIEELIPLSDGVHTYMSSKFPLIDSQGEIYAIGSISTDITESARQEMRQEQYLHKIEEMNVELEAARLKAEEANRYKSLFLANMSHEIRTPLNGVIGFTSLLNRTKLEAKQDKYVQSINLSAKVLLELIDNILDFTKIEAGEMSLERAPIDLHRLIYEVKDMLAGRAEEKHLEIAVQIEEGTPHWVLADSLRLRQVLTNITHNAIKFTEKGGVLIVVRRPSLEGEDYHRIRFEIRDTGIGIPKEKQTQLFQKFYQADASITRRFGGTGLGLAICKQLVELMGGNIGLSSTPGVGSLFWIEVPFETVAPVLQQEEVHL